MREPRRRNWVASLDDWAPDNLALVRTKEAIADVAERMVDDELRRSKEALARMDEDTEVACGLTRTGVSSPRPEPEPEYRVEPEPARRNVVAELVQRIRDGDLSAIEMLRKALDR